MLINKIRQEIENAVRSGDTIKRDILKLVLGESQLKNVDDDKSVVKIVKKIIQSNEETLKVGPNEKLTQENSILIVFVPVPLSKEELKVKLADIAVRLREAKNDGQATGMSISHLNRLGVIFEGGDVAEAVKEIRSESGENFYGRS